jgi:hypothetical protein
VISSCCVEKGMEPGSLTGVPDVRITMELG